jgi:Plasmid encoded RepA protein
MLKHVGQYPLELLQSACSEVGITPLRVLAKADAAVIVRQKRNDRDQDVAFGARPFILCGLPIRSLPPGTNKYTRRNGRFFLEVVGHPDHGVPYGQDRLVLIWVATLAVRHKTSIVEFDSAAQILWEFGLPPNGIHYKRLADGFKRVFGSTVFFGTEAELVRGQVWECGRGHFFDQMKIWFREDECGARRGNQIILSDSFWQELKAHPIPVDREVVRALASNPGCLDLYTWLTWRCFQAKPTVERIPLFGPFGLANQLGVGDYTRERKFRERLRLWLDIVRAYWPQCPAAVAKNGHFLELNRATALNARFG